MATSIYWKLACVGGWLAVQVSEFLTNSGSFAGWLYVCADQERS